MRGLGLEAVAYDIHAADDQRHHGDTDRDPGEHAPLRLAVLAGCVDGESGQQYRQQREECQQTPAVHTDEGDQQEHRGDDDREHRQLGGLLVTDIGCVGCIGSVRSAGAMGMTPGVCGGTVFPRAGPAWADWAGRVAALILGVAVA